jgi:hypothetical protein
MKVTSPMTYRAKALLAQIDIMQVRINLMQDQIDALSNAVVEQAKVTDLNVERVGIIADIILSQEDDMK